MRELTMRQMSETNGGIGFRSRFFSGFLCGSLLTAAFLITPTTSMIARVGIYAGAISACGHAFFV